MKINYKEFYILARIFPFVQNFRLLSLGRFSGNTFGKENTLKKDEINHTVVHETYSFLQTGVMCVYIHT